MKTPVACSLLGLVVMGTAFAGQTLASSAINIGTRLELFVDDLLVDEMRDVEFRLHHPVKAPRSPAPFPGGFYGTVIKDGDLYRTWYRGRDPDYDGPTFSGHPGETLQYAESPDGVHWTLPNFGKHLVGGTRDNNVIMFGLSPFLHNLSPFLDDRPGVPANERYKAVAGYPGVQEERRLGGPGRGLFAFVSPDGINWEKRNEIIPFRADEWRHAFDSANLAFWSEAEQLYVCYFRTWTEVGRLRSVSRSTSADFVHWSEPVALDPNLPREHLYTTNTQPYVRAPHIYIALPTRYVVARGTPGAGSRESNSTDILFMSKRAGALHYDRLFTEAFIRPGRDPALWGNRANYVAQNVVLTAPDELSIYHKNGDRYTLRTDGFISVRAGAGRGELVTHPVGFSGSELVLNFSTSAAGSMAVELLTPDGEPVPGFSLAEAQSEYGDHIEHVMTWGGADLASIAGQPVRLRFVMHECDLYSFRFR